MSGGAGGFGRAHPPPSVPTQRQRKQTAALFVDPFDNVIRNVIGCVNRNIGGENNGKPSLLSDGSDGIAHILGEFGVVFVTDCLDLRLIPIPDLLQGLLPALVQARQRRQGRSVRRRRDLLLSKVIQLLGGVAGLRLKSHDSRFVVVALIGLSQQSSQFRLLRLGQHDAGCLLLELEVQLICQSVQVGVVLGFLGRLRLNFGDVYAAELRSACRGSGAYRRGYRKRQRHGRAEDHQMP